MLRLLLRFPPGCPAARSCLARAALLSITGTMCCADRSCQSSFLECRAREGSRAHGAARAERDKLPEPRIHSVPAGLPEVPGCGCGSEAAAQAEQGVNARSGFVCAASDEHSHCLPFTSRGSSGAFPCWSSPAAFIPPLEEQRGAGCGVAAISVHSWNFRGIAQ